MDGHLALTPAGERAYAASLALAPSRRWRIPGLKDEAIDDVQRAAVEYMLPRRHGVMLADDMGIGKTRTAIAAVLAARALKVVVVTLAPVKAVWAKEARAVVDGRVWTHEVEGTSVDQLGSFLNQAAAPPCPTFLIMNYELLHAHAGLLSSWEPAAVIFDESHYLKTPGSLDARGRVKGSRRTAYAQELAADVRSRAGSVILCSGTMIPNRPVELVPQLELIGRLDEFGGWMGFVTRYCGAYRRPVKDKLVWDTSGATNLDELRIALRARCVVRRLRTAALPWLVKNEPAMVALDPDPQVMSHYRRAEEDIVRYLASEAARLAAEAGRNPTAAAKAAAMRAAAAKYLVELNKLRVLAATAKLASAAAWIDNHLATHSDPEDPRHKLVVFAHHKEIVSSLAERYSCLSIEGAHSARQRTEAIARFQREPSERLIVVSTAAGGTGVTLTAAADLAVLEPEWTPSALAQAEDRLARRGQSEPVQPYYLYLRGTVDETMMNLVAHKRSLVRRALDDVEPDAEGETKAFVADVMGEVMARAEEDDKQAARRIPSNTLTSESAVEYAGLLRGLRGGAAFGATVTVQPGGIRAFLADNSFDSLLLHVF
ncbi:MAG: DEAD/DEAH box helicase [Actinomycetota bacterium]|nr:DEAD/DEAH box helicase [Actinomycetota bacterium]